MVTQVGAAAGSVVCPWCAGRVAAAVPVGEDEPVFAVHPLPGPRPRTVCPASGLTAGEVRPGR